MPRSFDRLMTNGDGAEEIAERRNSNTGEINERN